VNDYIVWQLAGNTVCVNLLIAASSAQWRRYTRASLEDSPPWLKSWLRPA